MLKYLPVLINFRHILRMSSLCVNKSEMVDDIKIYIKKFGA